MYKLYFKTTLMYFISIIINLVLGLIKAQTFLTKLL